MLARLALVARTGRHRRPAGRGRLGGRTAGDGREHAAELRLAAAPGARRPPAAAPGGARVRAGRRRASVFDACRFEDRVAEARAALHGDPSTALLHVEAGLAEWHGPALADVVDEEWARPAAVRWDELRLEALETRFDALLALGRHGEAVGELERTTDEHPLREGFARRLMIALYRSGRQADALRVLLAHARRALRGARPRSDARAVRAADGDPQPRSEPRRARAGRRAGRRRPRRHSRPRRRTPHRRRSRRRPWPCRDPPCAPVPASSSAATSSWPTCTACGRPASPAASRIALLVGEAGAGKSRLAARFAADVHELGAIVLWGRATAEAIVPFEPMVEAMRTVLRTVSPEARRRVASERGLLQLLLPELDQLVPEARFERPDPSVERYLLFETIAELLRAESSEHPVLIVLDDLHWADAPSLKMIEHVVRHELPGRVMVVGTVRSPADDPTPDLDRVAAGLARDGLLARVPVGRLRHRDASPSCCG